MDREKPEGWALERISRRRALKRVAAGTAIAWSAPVLTSLTSSAFAQYACDWVCDVAHADINCGTCDGGNPICRCNLDTEGNEYCWNGCTFCGVGSECTTSADCTTLGERCVPVTCCGTNQCLPGCEVPARVKADATGRRAGAVL
jgi:hypothetical protein